MITIERNKMQGSKGKAYFFLYSQFDATFHKEVDRNGLHNSGWDFWIEYSGVSEFIAVGTDGKEIKKYELTKREITKLLKENKDFEIWAKINKSAY